MKRLWQLSGLTEERLLSALSAIKLRLMKTCNVGWLSKNFSHLWCWVGMIISLFFLSLNETLFPYSSYLVWQLAQGRVLVVPSFLQFRMMEFTVLWGTYSAAVFLLWFSAHLCPTIQSLTSEDCFFEVNNFLLIWEMSRCPHNLKSGCRYM